MTAFPQKANSMDAPVDNALHGLVAGVFSELAKMREELAALKEQRNNGGKEWPLSSEQVGAIIKPDRPLKARTVETQYLATGRIKAHKGPSGWLVYPSAVHEAIGRNFERPCK